jgi:predicted solute-binding protein
MNNEQIIFSKCLGSLLIIIHSVQFGPSFVFVAFYAGVELATSFMQRLIQIVLKANDWIIKKQYRVSVLSVSLDIVYS